MSSPQKPSTSLVQNSETFPKDDELLRVKLTEVYIRLSNALNVKEIGLYDVYEQFNGKQFYNPKNSEIKRNGYTTVFPFGAIPSGGTLTIPHELTKITMFTDIYGTASDGTSTKPMPYAAISIGYQIDLYVDSTNIYIKNGTAGTAAAIVSGVVILEYLKN